MMPDLSSDPAASETMRCPTCRAVQQWSESCRRCKCDLRLLRQTSEEYAAWRRRCLWSLHQQHHRQALAAARQCFTLRRDDESRRLLAVCALLQGDWASACAYALPLLPTNGALPGASEQVPERALTHQDSHSQLDQTNPG